MPAEDFIRQIENNEVSNQGKTIFQRQFERLVVLDYIIRNTGEKVTQRFNLKNFFVSLNRNSIRKNSCSKRVPFEYLHFPLV